MSDLSYFTNKIKGFKSIYLAGGIQSASNPNSWRNSLAEFFEKNEVKVFNPVNDNAAIFNQSILGFKDDGTSITTDELQDIDELKEAILFRQTEWNDKKAIKDADVVFFYLDGRIGHGTMKEFDWAFDWKKSVIIVRTIPRRQLSHWNKWRRYFALVIDRNAIEFRSLTEAKQYFISELGFKE